MHIHLLLFLFDDLMPRLQIKVITYLMAMVWHWKIPKYRTILHYSYQLVLPILPPHSTFLEGKVHMMSCSAAWSGYCKCLLGMGSHMHGQYQLGSSILVGKGRWLGH